jgi:glutamate 5-kinase
MYRRIVVKLGTGVLTKGTRFLNQPQMVELTRQIASLHHHNKEVIVCTSGAQAAGRALLDFPDLPATLASRQMLAAVGQSRLMLLWGRFFQIYGILVGQILLTRADTENRQRFLNARDTFYDLLRHRIVPVVNENDAVAVEEIKVGDNDNLSALVAVLTDADLLLMLTDQPGLFTADPRSDPEAQLIPEVNKIDDSLRALAGSSQSGLGIGGMSTKLQAAEIACRAGTDVVIAAGSAPDVIVRAVAGQQVGTRFPAQETPLENRKRWILAGPAPSGRLLVDAGAAKALRLQGNSLLPVGITAVEGEFERGDAVFVKEGNGSDLARGITRYSSNDLHRIRGCQSHEISERLGYGYGPVALHRNDMILLE